MNSPEPNKPEPAPAPPSLQQRLLRMEGIVVSDPAGYEGEIYGRLLGIISYWLRPENAGHPDAQQPIWLLEQMEAAVQERRARLDGRAVI